MSRHEFISKLVDAMYQNHHPFSKQAYIIEIIDTFIYELNNKELCKNCKQVNSQTNEDNKLMKKECK